jgi:hypothetical protein
MKRLFALVGAAALALMVQPAGASDGASESIGSNWHPPSCTTHDATAQSQPDATADASTWNHRDCGSITVTKVVTGALAPSDDDVFYGIELWKGGHRVGTEYVSAGHSVTWDDLSDGTYSLRELGEDSFTETWWPSSTVVIDKHHERHSLTLTNDYGSGSITLTKTVEGEAAPSDAAFSFVLVADDMAEQQAVDAASVEASSVDIRVLKDGESTTWDGLSAGRYRIIELTSGSFTTTWSPSDVVVIDGDHRHVDVLATNDFGELYTGYIKVTKAVAGSLAPEGGSYQVRLESDEGEDGWVEIGTRTVTAGETVAWFGLPHGTYRVVELTEGAFTTSWSPSSLVVLDELHESEWLTVTNDYGDPAPTGSVTVRKLATGSLAPADASFTMTLVQVTGEGTTTVGVATLRSGESYTWSDLPYGDYRIVESPAAGATTSYSPSSDVTVGAESQAVSVLVTNAYGDPAVVEPTTTTTAPTTTTTQETTTTTAAPTTTAASGVSNEALAFTGGNTLFVAGIGLAIVALGIGLVAVSRRRGHIS